MSGGVFVTSSAKAAVQTQQISTKEVMSVAAMAALGPGGGALLQAASGTNITDDISLGAAKSIVADKYMTNNITAKFGSVGALASSVPTPSASSMTGNILGKAMDEPSGIFKSNKYLGYATGGFDSVTKLAQDKVASTYDAQINQKAMEFVPKEFQDKAGGALGKLQDKLKLGQTTKRFMDALDPANCPGAKMPDWTFLDGVSDEMFKFEFDNMFGDIFDFGDLDILDSILQWPCYLMTKGSEYLGDMTGALGLSGNSEAVAKVTSTVPIDKVPNMNHTLNNLMMNKGSGAGITGVMDNMGISPKDALSAPKDKGLPDMSLAGEPVIDIGLVSDIAKSGNSDFLKSALGEDKMNMTMAMASIV